MNDYEVSRNTVGAVNEFRAATELRVLYENLYKKKYKTLPFIEDTDATTFAFIASKFKGPEGPKLLEAYFDVQDRFIQENCHPIGMIRKSINKLLPMMAKHTPQPTGGIRIKAHLSCDYCNQYFDWIGDARVLMNPRKCQECVASKRTSAVYFNTRKALDRAPMIKSMQDVPNPEAEDPEDFIERTPTIASLPSVSEDSD